MDRAADGAVARRAVTWLKPVLRAADSRHSARRASSSPSEGQSPGRQPPPTFLFRPEGPAVRRVTIRARLNPSKSPLPSLACAFPQTPIDPRLFSWVSFRAFLHRATRQFPQPSLATTTRSAIDPKNDTPLRPTAFPRGKWEAFSLRWPLPGYPPPRSRGPSGLCLAAMGHAPQRASQSARR
jgi:hypothetical protein